MRLPGGPARFLKAHHLIAALAAATVAVACITGFAWANKRVTVIVDGTVTEFTTQSADVASLLAEAGVRASANDLVSPGRGTEIVDGDVVVVRHAIPVTLHFGDERILLNVVGRTVADALVAAGLDPTSGMQTDPAVDSPLEHDMEITATDVFIRVAQEEVVIPFDVVVVGDVSAAPGSRKVTTPGVAGTSLKVYQVLVVGGAEGPRFLKAQKQLVAPVTEVVTLGTSNVFRQVMVSRGQSRPTAPDVAGRTIKVTSTAYTPWDPSCIGHTEFSKGFAWVAAKRKSLGIPDGWGIIAVDERVIPLKSKVFVEGYGYAIACDTGGVIHGKKIDVCFWGADSNAPSSSAGTYAQVRQARDAAYRWGAAHRRGTVTVTVLGK
ncbi:MAG: 3D domain-containing protein [Coriobacteriia bacterium]|nr:3D domain-containing protein [Coriobacteriia bacterium]